MSPKRRDRVGHRAGGDGRGLRARVLRPTSARVRTALFDSLAAAVDGAAVLDLFAGSGTLGLEALRRGARRVVFVERDPRHCRAVQRQVERSGLSQRAEVWCDDVLSALSRLGSVGARFDVVMLDPPYGHGWIPRVLVAMREAGVGRPGAVVVAEGHWRDRPELGSGYVLAKEARYGETALWYIRPESHEQEERGHRVRIAVYPGSFDPVHYGHIEIVRRAAQIFDKVIVAVAENVEKVPGAFPLHERVAMLTEVLSNLPSVVVAAYTGLTVDFALSHGATCLVKGLRAVGDFDYELKQSAMNRRLAPSLDTLLLIADPEYAFVSSSLIREVARLGGSVDSICPPPVVRRLRARWPESR